MAYIAIFAFSGTMVLLLPVAKHLGQGRENPFIIFRLISRGETHAREIYHTTIHLYTEWKERLTLLFKKKIYLYSRNILNKLSTFVEEKRLEYLNNMRDSKLLKRQDGISEFYKNMSSVEKGNGEIYEDFEFSSKNLEETVR